MAIFQLSVPMIAAVGGVFVLSEAAEPRSVIAGVFILGGIGLTVATKSLVLPDLSNK